MTTSTRSTRTLRRILRLPFWPVRRLLDPRFADVNRRIGATRQSVQDESNLTRHVLTERTGDLEGSVLSLASSHTESLTFVGTQLRAFEQDLRDVGDRLVQVEERVEPQLFLERRVDELIAGNGEGLDAAIARLLNFAESHEGFAARDQLWMNHPVSVRYERGGTRLGDVNERIVEVPYAFRTLAGLPDGARILDVGSAESTVALSLASLGYDVVALDLHRYPFSHPNLTVVESRLEAWEPEPGSFDAIVCISTIEHVGLGWYGDAPEPEGADRRALARFGEWLKPDGVIVLTVPYGEAGIDELERTYDRTSLDALVDGWRIEDRTIVVHEDSGVWTVRDDVEAGDAVAMLVVRPSASD
jgi:SAM-dependent methyltransferase